MSKIRLFSEWLVLLIAAAALIVVANTQRWAERLDLFLLDFGNSLVVEDGLGDITIVAIDDPSLAEIGNWPWNRARHAELIDRIAELEPAVIAVDVLFLEPSNDAADSALANSIANAGNVVLPYTFVTAQDGSEEPVPVYPVAKFADAALGMGYVSIDPDYDGVVRRFAPAYNVGERQFDHFAQIVANHAGFTVQSDGDPNGVLPIIQYHSLGAYRTENAKNIIQGSAQKEFFKDKIVFIGATAQGLGDRHAVPSYAGRIMPGVEVQANALDAMVRGKLISGLSGWAIIALHLAAVVSLFLVYWLRPPAAALRYSIFLIAALILGAFASIILFRTWVPVAPALLAILIAYPFWGWRRLETVSRFLGREVAALRAQTSDNGDVTTSETADDTGWLSSFGASTAGFDVVQTQVTNLRGLTGEVRQRLNFVQDVLDASPDPMMVFDGNNRLSLSNSKAREIFVQDEMITALTLPDMVDALEGEIDREASEVKLPNGRTYLLASAPLDEELGSEIVALRDISAIKHTEQQRQEILEFLSHDMRSPQVAIITLAGKSSKGIEESERLDRIVEQARRTLTLAENFVQIARLENDGIQTGDTDLSALVFEAADGAYAGAKRKNISIDCQVPEEPLFCQVDASAISRVVENLLSNALKFSPENSKVTISLSEPQNGGISLAIEDQGPGMPEERRAQPFARFGAHDSKAGPSVGLGLAYVKRAIDEHSGTIDVVSSPDKGTRIEIWLPANREGS